MRSPAGVPSASLRGGGAQRPRGGRPSRDSPSPYPGPTIGPCAHSRALPAPPVRLHPQWLADLPRPRRRTCLPAQIHGTTCLEGFTSGVPSHPYILHTLGLSQRRRLGGPHGPGGLDEAWSCGLGAGWTAGAGVTSQCVEKHRAKNNWSRTTAAGFHFAHFFRNLCVGLLLKQFLIFSKVFLSHGA